MKKLLILFALLLITSYANAQTQINPIIGVNFSQLVNEPDQVNSESRLGWQFGVNFRMGDRFYFQPGVHYAQLNTELITVEDADTISIFSSFQSNIGVLRVPLLAGFRIFSNEDKEALFNINAHAGVSAEWILAVDEESGGLTKDDFASPIFGAVLGAGIDFLFLTLDIDYEIGLTPVFDKERVPLSSEPKNNALVISVGGKFQF